MKNLFQFISLVTILSSGVFSSNGSVAKISKENSVKFYDVNSLSADSEELTRSLLDVSFTSSTTTKNSASYKLKIASVRLDAFCSGRYKYCYTVVNDDLTVNPTWKGSYSNYSGIKENIETFDSYINRIRNDINSGKETIYIPSLVTKKECFIMSVSTIIADACTAHDIRNNSEYNDWNGIDSIYIPSTITKIESGAFRDVPNDVHIYCEAASQPAGWEENWCDNLSVVEFGVEYAEPKRKEISCDQSPVSFGEATNYITGYISNENFDGEQYNLPLVLAYDVEKGGATETRFYEFAHTSKTPYDGVGDFKNDTTTYDVDILLDSGEVINSSSFKLYNIFAANRVDITPEETDESKKRYVYTVDFDKKYYAVPRMAFTDSVDLSDFVSLKFKSVSTFMDYSDVRLSVELGEESTYERFMNEVYLTNKYKIDNGDYKIRYSFQNLEKCSFRVKYIANDGTEKETTFSIYTPNGAQVLEENDDVLSFMFKTSDIGDDFNPSKMTYFEIIGLTCQIDLYSRTGSILNVSKFSRRFGRTVVLDGDEYSTISIDALIWISLAAYIVLYSICAAILYFYRKEKYKNDEFRRMNTKRYVRSAIIGLFGSIIVLLAVLFIILRWSSFISTMVVHNPIDAFVIGFSLVGLIVFGYGVRNAVVSIKTEQQRKLRIKLKLNDDTEDDGTK